MSSNIIVIVLDSLSSSVVSPERTPFLTHVTEHGNNFKSHLTGGGTAEDNLYRILYSIPVFYRTGVRTSAFINELEKLGYDLSVFSDRNIPGLPNQKKSWDDWIAEHQQKDPSSRSFLFIDIQTSSPEETDARLKETFTEIEQAKLLPGSAIIITGTHSSAWDPVPMTLILPDRSKSVTDHRTTHFDIVPTLLKKILDCKAPVSTYSFGKILTEAPSRDWEIFGSENSLRIADFSRRSLIESDWKGSSSSEDLRSLELVLRASREGSRFFR